MVARTPVTIGIPAFNSSPEYFGAALEGFLEQSFGDFELIISDDGSTPEAAALYAAAAGRDSRVRVIRHDTNRGHAWNFNHLLRQARGKYFLLGSDDDIRPRTFLSDSVSILDQQPDAVGVSSEVLLVNRHEEPIRFLAFDPTMASRSVVERISSLASGVLQFDYYGLFHTEALRSSSLADPDVHDLWGIETLVVFELLLRGPLLRVQQGALKYRMKDGWQENSLAGYLIANQLDERHPLFHQERRLSRSLRRAFLRHPLPWADKARGFLALQRGLSSVFTSERRSMARHHFNVAVRERRILAAAAAAGRYLALSPRSALRTSAWRSLFRGSTVRL